MRGDADLALVARDPALPGLRDVLAPTPESSWWLAVRPEDAGEPVVEYVKYKPGQSCLAGVTATTPGGTARFVVKAWRPDDPALTSRDLVDARRTITVTRFPEDDKVRGLQWLLDPDSRDRAHQRLALPSPDACHLETLAWKPERRAVFRVTSGGAPIALVKCHARSAAAQSHAASLALAALPFPTPTVRGVNARRGVLAYDWIAGTPLTHATASPAQCAEAGRLLAQLHASRPSGLADRAPGQRELLRSALGTLAVILPDAFDRATQALDALALRRDPRGPTVPVHGDFYVKQLLATTDGMALLDFDEAAMGDAHEDLAIFLAHVERDVARGVLAEGRGEEIADAFAHGYGVARPSLDAAVAEQLLGLVHHPFRHRSPNWPAETRALIERAHALLARRRPTLVSGVRSDATLAMATPLLETAGATSAIRAGLPEYPNAAVQQVRITRHKAGRRALLSLDVLPSAAAPVERWLVKVRGRGTDHRSHALQRALWDAGLHAESDHGVSVPEPIGVLDVHHATIQRGVAGTSLSGALAQGLAPAELGHRVARVLHVLHTSQVRVARRWTIDDELGMLDNRLSTLGAAHPSLAPRVSLLWRRVVHLATPLHTRTSRALAHRDFYHDQVLFDAGRTWLLDLDCCAMGDPAMDVGNFAAHLIEASWRGDLPAAPAGIIDATLQDDTALRGDACAPDAVMRWTALSLARLVEIAVHHANRRLLVAGLLDRVLQWLPARDRNTAVTPQSLRSLEVAS